jgi:hypothetical protein
LKIMLSPREKSIPMLPSAVDRECGKRGGRFLGDQYSPAGANVFLDPFPCRSGLQAHEAHAEVQQEVTWDWSHAKRLAGGPKESIDPEKT